MFARVSSIEGKPDQLDAAVAEYREKIVPWAGTMAGFVGAYLLIDRKSGKNLSITLWDTEKNLQASVEAANKVRASAARTVGASKPPVVEIYEVAVQPKSK
jgi:heme-degrading monooxygenase HmoA